MRILCVADGDTRLKWAHHVAAAIDPEAAVASALVVGRTEPTSGQLADVGIVAQYQRVAPARLASGEALADHDVVIVCTVGETCWHVVRGARRRGPRRPLVVTGYAGLVYEKHLEGLLWRTGADIICVNSEHDLELFERTLTGLNLDGDPLVLTGPGVLLGVNRDAPHDGDAVVFATQPSVPQRRAERVYVLERLRELAEHAPHQRVLVKLRTRPGEITAHPEPHHYETLHRKVFGNDLPQNLHFVSGPMSAVLDQAAGLVTVSSTAAAEAMARSIPTAILTDLGVREGLGNHAFVGSGCLTSFDHLLTGGFPHPRTEWLDDHGINETEGAKRLHARVGELLDHRANGTLTDPEMFTSPERTPYLARHTSDPVTEESTNRLRRAAHAAIDRYGRRIYERLAAWAAQH